MGSRNAIALYSSYLYNIHMTISKYKSNRNVVYSCKYHVVWCTKYRRKLLNKNVQTDLKNIIEYICLQRQCEIVACDIVDNHAHLLVEVDPQYGIHRLIKEIKGKSSRLLRLQYKHLSTRVPTLWTNSYFVCTVGGAPLSVIKKYVENQNVV